MPRADRLLASDLDGTLIAADATPASASDVRAFASAVAAVGPRLAYVTGRHLALAVEGTRRAGLPPPDLLSCDVGTRLYRRVGPWDFAPDAAFDAIMRAAPGGGRLADAARHLAGLSFLDRQPDDRQGEFKLSFDMPRDAPADAAARVRDALAGAELRLQVVDSTDPVTGTGLIDVLPSGAGKHRTLAFLEEQLALGPDDIVFAGDSGNDRDALLGPWLGVLVGNAPADLAESLRHESRRRGHADRLYVASAPCVRGVIEGCRHFGFL